MYTTSSSAMATSGVHTIAIEGFQNGGHCWSQRPIKLFFSSSNTILTI